MAAPLRSTSPSRAKSARAAVAVVVNTAAAAVVMAVAVAIATELALARVEVRQNRASIFFGSRRLARALVAQTSSLLCRRFAIGTPLQTTNEHESTRVGGTGDSRTASP